MSAAFLSGIFLFKNQFVKNAGSTDIQIQSKNNPKNQMSGLFKEEANKKPVKILFVGDLMFDRYIREIAQKKSNEFIFEKIESRMKSADLVIANLEGPLTDNNSVSIGTTLEEKNHLVFTFDKSLAETLFKNNVRLVNIGNNHILNFGKEGLLQTKTILNEKNIDYFGDTGENAVYVANVGGQKISFVNYNQFSSGSFARTLENIKNLRNQSDILIVYAHWGIEYQEKSNKNIQEIGHIFIDSGVDMVIGSHPHVIQEKENYKERWIYYSLGNFVFDQYFSPKTKKGLAVEVSISSEKKINFEDIPLTLDNNGQTRFSAL